MVGDGHAVLAGSEEVEGQRGEEIERLDLDAPGAARLNGGDIPQMGEEDRDDHLKGDDKRRHAGLVAEDDQDRRDHFGEIDAVAEHTGDADGTEGLFNEPDPATQLRDPVEEHEASHREPQEEESDIPRGYSFEGDHTSASLSFFSTAPAAPAFPGGEN